MNRSSILVIGSLNYDMFLHVQRMPVIGETYPADGLNISGGGKGSILGTMLGALLLAALKIGMIVIGVQSFWQFVVTGIIIVIAAYFETIQDKLSKMMLKRKANVENVK